MPDSLVMAIGIAAFNRFTEDENTQSLTTMDAVLTTSENQTLTKGIALAAKKVLAQLCNVTRNMFASIGVCYKKEVRIVALQSIFVRPRFGMNVSCLTHYNCTFHQNVAAYIQSTVFFFVFV